MPVRADAGRGPRDDADTCYGGDEGSPDRRLQTGTLLDCADHSRRDPAQAAFSCSCGAIHLDGHKPEISGTGRSNRTPTPVQNGGAVYGRERRNKGKA